MGSIFGIIFLVHLFGLRDGIRYGPVMTAAYYLGIVSGYSPGLHLSKFLAVLLRPKAPKRYSQTIWPVLLFHVLHYYIIYLVGPVIGIVSVERMIVTNGLTTPGITGSAGQMIALLTGIFSMCLTIWECGHL